MSVTYCLKVLSVDIRSETVVHACSTVAWSLPPISAPIVDREQFAIRLRDMYIAKIGRASCRERVCQYV